MKHRTFMQTVLKSTTGILTTPPNTWHKQWKERNLSLRERYLNTEGVFSENELLVGTHEVMQDWEHPLMHALAKDAARNKGHVLEVGFGMGISAGYLIAEGCSKYTVIEPHPTVLRHFRTWALKQPVPVDVVQGFWEDVIDDLGVFDGILFDTYPTSTPDFQSKVYLPFIPKASEHLRPGGVFTFYSGCPDTLPPEHMELLRKYFSSIDLYHVTGLEPPKDCTYYSDSKMVVPVCTK